MPLKFVHLGGRLPAASEKTAQRMPLPALASDGRAVLGIARGVGQACHPQAGTSMISSKEHHEVPA